MTSFTNARVFFAEKCASQTFFSSVADEAKKLPISRRVQFQAKVMSLLAETLDEPAV